MHGDDEARKDDAVLYEFSFDGRAESLCKKHWKLERLDEEVSMSGNWPINPNLSVKGLTYRQWKVDYDPLCDECIARGRTHDLLRSITGLIEETGRPSAQHMLFSKSWVALMIMRHSIGMEKFQL